MSRGGVTGLVCIEASLGLVQFGLFSDMSSLVVFPVVATVVAATADPSKGGSVEESLLINNERMFVIRPTPAAPASDASLELDASFDLGVGATPAAPARDRGKRLFITERKGNIRWNVRVA